MAEKLQFAGLVFKGLAEEVTTDPELLVLTAAGLALASRSRPLRGIGIAMGGWYITRKADTYMTVFDSKMRLVAAVIDAGNPKLPLEVNERTASTRSEGRTPPR